MRNLKTRWSSAGYDPDGDVAVPIGRALTPNRKAPRKFFSDRLGPLQRYLARQVGRPWRKLEGELRKAVDLRTVVGRHLWDHVLMEVELRVRMLEDGRPVRLDGRPIRSLYVHPRTGLLLRPKPRRIDEARARRKRIENAGSVVLDAATSAEKKGDLWYLLIDEGRAEEIVEKRKDRAGNPVYRRTLAPVIRRKQANTEEVRRIQAALEATVK